MGIAMIGVRMKLRRVSMDTVLTRTEDHLTPETTIMFVVAMSMFVVAMSMFVAAMSTTTETKVHPREANEADKRSTVQDTMMVMATQGLYQVVLGQEHTGIMMMRMK